MKTILDLKRRTLTTVAMTIIVASLLMHTASTKAAVTGELTFETTIETLCGITIIKSKGDLIFDGDLVNNTADFRVRTNAPSRLIQVNFTDLVKTEGKTSISPNDLALMGSIDGKSFEALRTGENVNYNITEDLIQKVYLKTQVARSTFDGGRYVYKTVISVTCR